MPKICFRDYQLMNPLKNMFHPITIYIKVKNKGAELPLLKKIRTDNRVSPCFHIQPYTNHVLLKRHTISSMKASKDGNRSNPAFHLKSGRASKTVLTRLCEAERQEIWRTHGMLQKGEYSSMPKLIKFLALLLETRFQVQRVGQHHNALPSRESWNL
ncbi:hypothetical protein YC2023_005363 [Brassica napus]